MDRIPPAPPEVIDMTPDGAFRVPPRRAGVPLSFKLMVGAGIIAVLAGAASIAALALWVVSLLLPVLVIAAGVAWVSFKYRQWKRTGSLGSERNLSRR